MKVPSDRCMFIGEVSAQSMPPGWDRAPPTQGFNPRGGFDAYAQQPFDPYRDPYAYEQGPRGRE